MKIIIHPSLKRPWGVEVPYTYISDTDEICDGFLFYAKSTELDEHGNVVREIFPEPKVTEEDVLVAVEIEQAVSVKQVQDDEQLLLDRKTELESELSDIEAKLAAISNSEQKEIK